MKGTLQLLIGFMITMNLTFPALAETTFIDVTIAYPERIALPPDAVVDVELLDTSKTDVVAVRLSSQRFKMVRVPQAVKVGYDPALIDPRHTYTVAARILSKGNVIFRTTTSYPVLTRNANDTANLTLVRMNSVSAGDVAPQRIVGIAWEAYEIEGRALSAEDKPMLTIDDEGRFGLFGGCNRFTGSVDLRDDGISFPAQFAGTQMACTEPQARLERDALDALGRVAGYTRSGKLLAFTTSEGTVMMRLRERPE